MSSRGGLHNKFCERGRSQGHRRVALHELLIRIASLEDLEHLFEFDTRDATSLRIIHGYFFLIFEVFDH